MTLSFEGEVSCDFLLLLRPNEWGRDGATAAATAVTGVTALAAAAATGVTVTATSTFQLSHCCRSVDLHHLGVN